MLTNTDDLAPNTRYELEWCSEIPEVEGCPGEGDHDRAVLIEEHFGGISEALKRAKYLIRTRKDAYGEVRIYEQEFERPCHWNTIQTKYVSSGSVSPWQKEAA